MKRAFRSSILSLTMLPLLLAVSARADDPPYLAALKTVRERYLVLDMARNDYRKPKPELPPAQEEERLRLLGQLWTDDPVWVLARQVQDDIDALVAKRSQVAADTAIIEALKDLLAVTVSFEGRAATRAQAETFATALRQFIARRDVSGAEAWAKTQ